METETYVADLMIETRGQGAPPVSAPYRATCTVRTYGEWLTATNAHPIHYDTVIGRMVDLGGSWTVGDDVLVWPHGAGLAPRPLLERAVLYGHATKSGPDTWTVTAAGRTFDLGRPHPVPMWTRPQS